MKNYIILGIILIIALCGIGGCSSYISYNNQEVMLRNEAEAQRKVVEGVHDKMWKIISQKAQVSADYAEKFDSIYSHIISGRYEKGDGSLMKWITESNPDFDTSLYESLAESIESERIEFNEAQKRMTDIIREHNDLRMTFPGNIFIKNNTEIKYEMVTSNRSKQAMDTGIDDDVNLFK